MHVYGPADRYPVAATRAFDVPDALPARLRALHDTLGVERLVLVQPSGYGTDNRRHLEAVAELGRPARVIVALRAEVQDAELDRLHEAGVRGSALQHRPCRCRPAGRDARAGGAHRPPGLACAAPRHG
ncbi:amidohydrolase family protein [Delftia sp.]|uniref:amidohydrolase family protein n=1 Tax=Delftia sp. TaxID=1886637 RepID=UPI00259C9926|nr:amidohydrolase family protein [Delftia sp.]